ncbi:hypothetical protein V2G26_015066 [Clonostachys chloroleuca]
MAGKGTTLDMSLFYGTTEQKQAFCRDLLHVLRTRGGVKLQNHPIPDKDIYELFSWTKKFFELPLETKMKAEHPPEANPNRGYSYVGLENVGAIRRDGKITRDIKETVDFGSPTDDLVDNRWVPEEDLPGFRTFMENFYDKAFKAELDILTALAIALGVDEQHLRSIHNRAENEFRILHYPAIPASDLSDGTATRIGEHTDFGTITLLFQDAVGGLQVEDQENLGTFRDIESASPTDMILNIGDSLQRLTNDTFKAATHRVTYPPSIKAGDERILPERYSVAYFAKPNRQASLLPLKEFITEATPCHYDDVTAWEWNNARIAALFGM